MDSNALAPKNEKVQEGAVKAFIIGFCTRTRIMIGLLLYFKY